MKRGFTLVELAIVLVIIGLLIGGILVAQSMIATANITATVKQIQQFDAGVENFKTKYGYLPGDAPAFGGDGDGWISWQWSGHLGSSANDIYACEIANFWNQMDPVHYPYASGPAPCGGSGSPVYISGANQNVPVSNLGSKGSFFIADSLWAATTPTNVYTILAGTQLQPGTNNVGCNRYAPQWTSSYNGPPLQSSAVKPADLLALDQKMDDGIANSGNVISGDIGGSENSCGCCGGPGIEDPLPACSVGATYKVQNNSYQCTPVIRIGAQAGDPS